MKEKVKEAEKVEHISNIKLLESSEGFGVHVFVDDEAIEKRAIRTTAYEGIEQPKHEKSAKEHGSGLATKAVVNALEKLSARDETTDVSVQIHSNHNIGL